MSRLSLDESRCYDTIKRTVLSYFKLDAQSYLKAFRAHKRTGKETYKMALNRLKELQAAYFESREIDSFEALADEMLMEQCLNSMPDDVKMFVWSKQPTTSEECAHYADIFYQMSRMSDSHAKTFYDGGKKSAAAAPMQKFSKQGSAGGPVKSLPQFGYAHNNSANSHNKGYNDGGHSNPLSGPPPAGHIPKKTFGNKQTYNQKQPQCWTCGSTSHKQSQCSQNAFMAPPCVQCGRFHNPEVPCRSGNKPAVLIQHSCGGCDAV